MRKLWNKLRLWTSTAITAVVPPHYSMTGFNLDMLIYFAIRLIIVGLIFYLIIWLVDWCGTPAPINKVIKVVAGVVLVLYLISLLLAFG